MAKKVDFDSTLIKDSQDWNDCKMDEPQSVIMTVTHTRRTLNIGIPLLILYFSHVSP